MEDRNMKKRIICSVLAGVLAVSMFAGCSSGGSQSGGRAYAAAEGESFDAKYFTAGEHNYVQEADYDYGFEESIELDAMPAGDAGAGGVFVNDVTVDPAKGRLLIRTVSMTAETKDIISVKNDIEAQVKALGGYIENSSMSGTGKNKDLRTINYTVRVPADQLDTLVSTVGNSCTIISSNENSSDVTLEYVDTKSRVESLRVEYDQLLKLLEQAEDLDTIIVLQNRLTEVRYQIESAESRIRVLENQVLYATLNLNVREVLEETEVVEPHIVTYDEKVMNQFEETWENTVEFFQDLLLGLISCIPGFVFLAVIAIVVLIIVFSARKKRRARIAKARAEQEAAAKKAAKEAEERAAQEAKEKEKADKKADSKDEGKE